MRFIANNAALKARAIAGTHVVILAWDFLEGQEGRRQGLLGFALERSELAGGEIIETYWMRGIKRFEEKDKSLPPGTPVSTAEHPIQTFQWGDYTARQGFHYRYRVVPVYGQVKKIRLDEDAALTLDVITERDEGTEVAEATGQARHDVYFNRGVIGSQAYTREFKDVEPDPEAPESKPMVWLSHGLYEGLCRFIDLAEDANFGLRCAFYEFHYQPVANRLAKAADSGADVKIVYDAISPSYSGPNQEVIHRAGLDARGVVIPRTVKTGIRHNKFMVLLKNDSPVAVWTGSTNISAGGIFGHSNVGHAVWDVQVASAYLEYWQRLSENTGVGLLRELNQAATPTPTAISPKNTIVPIFSPRDEDKKDWTLQWYADRMAEAREILCFTVAFDLDKMFQFVLSQENDVLRYVVKDDDLGSSEHIGHDRDVIFAAGSHLGKNALANFLAERGNPLNSQD